jgi:predicted DNA-binding WGR domain protein
VKEASLRYQLEKINPFMRQRRFYTLTVAHNLLGEWCLIREWGRIGSSGGQQSTQYFPSEREAYSALKVLKRAKNGRGYATIPVQLQLL